MKENAKITYFEGTVNKVKNNKALTLVFKLKDAEKLLKEFAKDDATSYYHNTLSESITYSKDNALKNVYIYMSSKYPIKCVEESTGSLQLVDVPEKSKVTIKLVDGFLNMIRIDEKYNPFSEF